MISQVINSIKSCQGRIIVIYGPRIKYVISQVIDNLTPNLVIFDAPICYSDKDQVYLLEVDSLRLSDLYKIIVPLVPKIRYIFLSAFNRFLSTSFHRRSVFVKFNYNVASELFLRELKFLLTLTRFNQNNLKLVFLPPTRCVPREDVWIPLPLFHGIFKLYATLIFLIKDDCLLQIKPELRALNLDNYSYSREDLIIKKCLSL